MKRVLAVVLLLACEGSKEPRAAGGMDGMLPGGAAGDNVGGATGGTNAGPTRPMSCPDSASRALFKAHRRISRIWRYGPDDVWVAANDVTFTAGYEVEHGKIFHWNGKGDWTSFDVEKLTGVHATNVTGLHGSAPNDLWAVGDNLTILHWDGVRWTVHSTEATAGLPFGTTVHMSVWSVDANNALIAGSIENKISETRRDLLLNWDGRSWMQLATGTEDLRGLSRLWATPDGRQFFILGANGLLRGAPGSWTVDQVRATSIHGLDGTNVWASTAGGGLGRFDGTAWRGVRYRPEDAKSGAPSLSGVHVVAPHQIWLRGTLDILDSDHPDFVLVAHATAEGLAFQRVLSFPLYGEGLLDMWASGPTDVCLIGTQGSFWHWDGQQLTKVP